MRFSLAHETLSYLLILSAALAVLSSPEVSPVTSVPALAGIVLSWFFPPRSREDGRLTTLWNLATVGFLGCLIVTVTQGASVIVAGAQFLLFVLVNKLFNRRSSRDFLQAYVVSFLLLVVATTLNTGLSFAIFFALFCLFAIWTLTLFHLRREIEDNYLLKHAESGSSVKVEVKRILDSRRIVGRAFLLATAAVWVGVLICAALVFLLFPRIGLGMFLGHSRGGLALAGFSERVQLGHHGLIRSNPSVVMRAVFPDGRPTDSLRWRGSVFDHYEGGAWSHNPSLLGRSEPVIAQDGLFLLNHAPGLPWPLGVKRIRQQLLRQQIYLEPLDVSVLFAADRPVALEQPAAELGGQLRFVPRRGPLGEIRRQRADAGGLSYTAYSHVTSQPEAVLRQAVPVSDPRWDFYLQLPADLPPRVRQLAQQITGEQPTVYDKVLAVQRYLRQHYRYTLQLTHQPGREPVDEFLFTTRSGHCEYFATAMALLLRSVGIHTRNVNGFVGGEWNAYGSYLAVRQGDAHSWVEVLLSNVGFVTFDPTPPAATSPAPEGSTAALQQLLDTLRLRWFRYVVEYDLRQQLSWARELGSLTAPASWRPATRGWPVLLGVAALLLAGAWLWQLRRRRPPKGRSAQAPAEQGVSRLYRRALALLAGAGYAKPQGITPLELVGKLDDRAPVKVVADLTRCYYEIRFGKTPWSEQERQRMSHLIEELQRQLRALSKIESPPSRPQRAAAPED